MVLPRQHETHIMTTCTATTHAAAIATQVILAWITSKILFRHPSVYIASGVSFSVFNAPNPQPSVTSLQHESGTAPVAFLIGFAPQSVNSVTPQHFIFC